MLNSEELKKCKSCETDQSKSMFYKHPNTQDKLSPYCKQCQSAISNRTDKRYRRKQEYFEHDYSIATI